MYFILLALVVSLSKQGSLEFTTSEPVPNKYYFEDFDVRSPTYIARVIRPDQPYNSN